jgi:hypothetical protein
MALTVLPPLHFPLCPRALPPPRARSFYLIYQWKTANIAAGALLGLGFLNTFFGVLMVTCGYKRRGLLKLYLLVTGLLEIAQMVLAILFNVDSQVQSIINAILPDSDENDASLRSLLEGDIKDAGYVLIAITGFQLLTLVLVALQACATNKSFDEEYREGQTAGLLSAGDDYGYGKASRRDKLATSGDRFNALADEGLGAAATDRARSKYAGFYEKYGRA